MVRLLLVLEFLGGAAPVRAVAARGPTTPNHANVRPQVTQHQLDARALGVVGDGDRDDAPALQASIETAAQANAVLFIPRGKYRLSSGLTLPSHTTIICDDGRAELLFESPSGLSDAILMSSANDVSISGCIIRGSRTDRGVARLISIVSNSARIEIARVRFSGGGAVGGNPTAAIRIEGGTDITVADCTFTGNGPVGRANPFSNVVVANWSGGPQAHTSRLRVERNKWFGNTAVFPLALYNVSEAAVVGNRIDQGNVLGNPKISGYGILLYVVDGATSPMRYNDVSGNFVENTAGSAIYLQGASYSTVSHNIVSRCAQQQSDDLLSVGCISISAGYAAWPTAVNVLVAHNVIDGSGRSGISVANGVGVSVVGNTLDHVALRGIQLITSNVGVTINANTIRSAGSHGVLIRGRAVRTTIVGNAVEGAAIGVGDYLDKTDVTATLVASNAISARECGIRFSAGAELQVLGNRVAGSDRVAGAAIESGGTNALIAQNLVADSAGDAVALKATSSRSRVSDNIVTGSGHNGFVDHGVANVVVRNGGKGDAADVRVDVAATHGMETPPSGMAGVARLVAGRASVESRDVREDDVILLSRLGLGSHAGHLAVERVVAGVGFAIASSEGADDGNVRWVVVR